MRYLSVCSGIEAATVAWHSLGWEPIGFAEIEPFPAAVLAHHYPEVPNFGDMTKYKEWNLESGTVDLLVGGTPCQSFSVAGLRKGLADPRGNLALVYCGILDHLRPEWFVWENVPGVLSSNGGRDFGSFLGALAELGYGFAYRVLDAQYFGVAQRRRRVFVVGYLGDWRPAAEVLFERESVLGHPAPSREKGKETAGTVTTRSGSSSTGGIGTDEACGGYLQPAYGIPGNWIGRQPENGGNSTQFMEEVAPCLTSADKHGVAQPIPFGVSEQPDVGHCLRSGASKADKHESTTYVAQPIAFQSVDFGADATINLSPTLRRHDPMAVAAFKYTMGAKARGIGYAEEQSPTFDTKPESIAVHQAMAVRRLTPVECERLQGFPDNYTNIPWRKADQSPDGPRYKALGNSMAVPVMAWIGRRIRMYNMQSEGMVA